MSNDEKWSVTVQSPMGERKSALSLSDVDGVVSGRMENEDGSTDVEKISVDSKAYAWSVKVPKPMPLTLHFSGTRDGDVITGTVKFGMFGNGNFEAIKSE